MNQPKKLKTEEIGRVALTADVRPRILEKQKEAIQKQKDAEREMDRQFYIGVVAGLSEAIIIIDGDA